MLRRLNYGLVIFLTLPFVILGVFVGIIEWLAGGDGTVASYIVWPYTWAYERKYKLWDLRHPYERRGPR